MSVRRSEKYFSALIITFVKVYPHLTNFDSDSITG